MLPSYGSSAEHIQPSLSVNVQSPEGKPYIQMQKTEKEKHKKLQMAKESGLNKEELYSASS